MQIFARKRYQKATEVLDPSGRRGLRKPGEGTLKDLSKRYFSPLVRAACVLLASALCLGLPAPAAAQSAPERAAKKPRPKAPNPRTRRAAEPRKKSPARPQGDPEKAAAAATTDATESGVKAAGTAVPEKPSAPEGEIREQQTADGVKRYEFGAIDVEGRLRSPQLLYFLRRVRAEFDAGALGHRSFLRELADTRNDAAFR